MQDIAIIGINRTAIGNLSGSLASLSAVDLGAVAIRGALNRAAVEPAAVSELIMGQILTGGAGMNPARQAGLSAGLPIEAPAMTINFVCGSGLRALFIGAETIRNDADKVVVAGGQESMSNAPHTLAGSRNGWRLGNAKAVDTLINDGLWDVFNDYHMGVTAENVATENNISRAEQDEFAAASQNKAEAAQQNNRFADEIEPVAIPQRKGEPKIFQVDEFPRHGSTAEQLAKLRPAFAKDGSVTAGNASGINDGAAAAVLMSADLASKRGLKPLAILRSWATVGLDPKVMGIGSLAGFESSLGSSRLEARGP